MTVIDERGRVFGLVNLVDAGVAALVVGVLAMVAVGFSVFKVPTSPELTRVEPASQPQAESMRVIVRGKNFLPFMRAVIQRTGDSAKAVQAVNLNPNIPVDRYALVTTTETRFFLESPSVGEVWLSKTVEPGTYDLVLFDESKQVVMKEAAFTITPPPPPPAAPAPPAAPPLPLATVRIYGTFSKMDRPGSSIAPGTRFTTSVPGESAEVLSRSAAEPDIVNFPVPAIIADTVRIPAIVRVRCSFTGGECRFGPTLLSPGAYINLTLKDREIRFYVSELVADSSPLAFVRVSGAFTRLDRPESAGIVAGTKFTSAVAGESGEVLSVGKVEPDLTRVGPGDAIIPATVEGKLRLPASLRVRCSFTGVDCRVYTTKLARNASISLSMGGRPYTFVIAELAPDTTETVSDARVAVRLVMRPELAGLIKQGDVDTRLVQGPNPAPGASARILTVGARRDSTSSTMIPAGDSQQTFNVPEPVVLTDVTLQVPVTESSGGWFYKGHAIKAGGALSFETAQYTVRGYILSVGIDTSPAKR